MGAVHMSLPELLLVCAAALTLVSLPILLVLSLRQSTFFEPVPPMEETDIERIAAMLSERLGITDKASIHNLTTRIEEMRADFDWLVSDRMIEQAIEMARLGQPMGAISQNTGISEDELIAIQRLRRH